MPHWVAFWPFAVTGDGSPPLVTANGENAFFTGDDYAFGFTLGATLEPAEGTRIGIGYRSSMEYVLDGKLDDNATLGGVLAGLVNPNRNLKANATLVTPDMITASVHQDITETFRVMATVEWSNWSTFDFLNVKAGATGNSPLSPLVIAPSANGSTIATLAADWEDGWYFSVGGELDISPDLTVRGGVAYEISPIDSPEKRLTALADADRIWVSAGFSYKVGQLLPFGNSTTIIDASYTHIFIDDASFSRETLSDSTLTLSGNSEAAADIISVSLRTKFGGAE